MSSPATIVKALELGSKDPFGHKSFGANLVLKNLLSTTLKWHI